MKVPLVIVSFTIHTDHRPMWMKKRSHLEVGLNAILSPWLCAKTCQALTPSWGSAPKANWLWDVVSMDHQKLHFLPLHQMEKRHWKSPGTWANTQWIQMVQGEWWMEKLWISSWELQTWTWSPYSCRYRCNKGRNEIKLPYYWLSWGVQMRKCYEFVEGQWMGKIVLPC